jgi:hypothetical protein
MASFDTVLRETLRKLRRAYDQNKSGFGSVMPRPTYNANTPATFCWNGLIRLLVLEGKAYQWKRGDSADFCHALLAASYSQVGWHLGSLPRIACCCGELGLPLAVEEASSNWRVVQATGSRFRWGSGQRSYSIQCPLVPLTFHVPSPFVSNCVEP